MPFYRGRTAAVAKGVKRDMKRLAFLHYFCLGYAIPGELYFLYLLVVEQRSDAVVFLFGTTLYILSVAVSVFRAERQALRIERSDKTTLAERTGLTAIPAGEFAAEEE